MNSHLPLPLQWILPRSLYNMTGLPIADKSINRSTSKYKNRTSLFPILNALACGFHNFCEGLDDTQIHYKRLVL